ATACGRHPYLQRTRMHAARAQPGEMPLADQQPGRPGLLLLRERTSQRIALLPGARAHRISLGRSAAQPGGCVSPSIPFVTFDRDPRPAAGRLAPGAAKRRAIRRVGAGDLFAGATWYPGKPARSIACCTNPEALACSMNSLM